MKGPSVKIAKISWIIITVAIILLVAGLSYFHFIGKNYESTEIGIDYLIDDADKAAPEQLLKKGHPAQKFDEKGNKMSLEDRLVRELKEFYGKTISEKSTQALLLKMKNFLIRLYPKDGELRFYNILKRAFPDLADEIMQTLKKMEQYKKWLNKNERKLSAMNDIEKEGILWNKRGEIFGEDAKSIWSDEVMEYENRKQAMTDTLVLLDGSHDTTMDEKLLIYKDSLDQAYKDTPEEYILKNTDMLSKVFFGIESVQDQLKQLEPEQRNQEIMRIRMDMGYTHEQAEKLQKMDDYRNRRWENGLAYMDERDRIVGEFEGVELDENLKTLRERFFKHEARTIELEEEDGFFRFNRKRIYGRN